MKKILDEPQDYESIVEAIVTCAISAAWAGDHHENGGITGFQGSWVMWCFIQHWMDMKEGEPLKLVKYEEMLYSQYNYKFAKTISRDTWDWLQEKADKCLNENGYAHPDVIAHWKSIVKETLNSILKDVRLFKPRTLRGALNKMICQKEVTLWQNMFIPLFLQKRKTVCIL